MVTNTTISFCLWINSVPDCVYATLHPFFSPQGLPISAVTKSAAMSKGVPTPPWPIDSNSFGIAESQVVPLITFLKKNLHTVFHNDHINLHSYQECRWIPLSKHPYQRLSSCPAPAPFLVTVYLGWKRLLVVWFVFPLSLVMLSIFCSCAWWPRICPLLKNLHSSHLPIFKPDDDDDDDHGFCCELFEFPFWMNALQRFSSIL